MDSYIYIVNIYLYISKNLSQKTWFFFNFLFFENEAIYIIYRLEEVSVHSQKEHILLKKLLGTIYIFIKNKLYIYIRSDFKFVVFIHNEWLRLVKFSYFFLKNILLAFQKILFFLFVNSSKFDIYNSCLLISEAFKLLRNDKICIETDDSFFF